MKIIAARVIVTCPGRNFVTLKIETDAGPLRPRATRTLNGRELAVVALPQRARDPVPDRPRRAPDRGHLAVPLPRRLLAARAGDDERDRRRRHRAVGHQGQGRRPAAVPAARRRARATACWSTATPTGATSTRPCDEVARYASWATRRSARRAACRGSTSTYGVGRRQDVLRAGRCGAADARTDWSTPQVPAPRAEAVRGAARALRLRPAPAARRAPPPDADRGGAARQGARALPRCSGWRTRRRPRTRRRSA